ncbi:MAG: hypothetical protein IIB59_05410, partial [Planctomycetes bacterium]|nr:hypothetical protein [Planctomycetota bacterium]
KQGCFIAGTLHELVTLEEAAARGVEAALLMNPNYRSEIEAMTRAEKTPMTLLDPHLKP